MKSILVLTIFVIISTLRSSQAETVTIDEFFIDSWPKSIADAVRQIFVPPENSMKSIQYLLYTRSNPKEPCYIEPTPEQFDLCPFDPTLETKILIHGFIVTQNNDNSFELIKDELLKHGPYNVIYVDWSRYNGHLYVMARLNTIPVGKKIAEFINFVTSHTGVKSKSFHLIGHSFGSHISGVAGEHVDNLGRITGLDPAGFLYEGSHTTNQLDATDAIFVDVIHTSYYLSGKGLGKLEPIGHIDFYPNGGIQQKEACYNSTLADKIMTPAKTLFDVIICNHFMSNYYFLHSIRDCGYVSTNCEDYDSLRECISEGKVTAKMGLYAEPVEGLPFNSKFYITTSGTEPFC